MAEQQYDFCVGTANQNLKRSIIAMLTSSGFISSGEGSNIPLFLRKIRTVQPWLAIIDTSLPPGNIDELANIIEDDSLAAALFINTGEFLLSNFVQLKWPVDSPVLIAVSEALCSEFTKKKALKRKVDELQKSLLDRKTIEQAKGLLAKHFSLNEDDAYRFLRKQSMEFRKPIGEIARTLLKDSDLRSALWPHR